MRTAVEGALVILMAKQAELEQLTPKLEAECEELQMEATRIDIEKIAQKLDG